MSEACFVGMDVSQHTVDIAIHPGTAFQIANNDQGIAEAVERVQVLQPTLIVLEATGGLEVPLAGALAAAALPVVVVNPRHVRDFARATGQLAKADRLDAHILAHVAEAIRPPIRPIPDEQTHALAALVAPRRQLIEMLTAEKNRARLAARPVQQRVQGAGPYRLAGKGAGAQHDQSGHHHAAESGVAGKGRRIAECAGCRAGAHHGAPRESSRAGHVDSQRSGGLSGRRAVPARQRHPQRPAGDLGWASLCAARQASRHARAEP